MSGPLGAVGPAGRGGPQEHGGIPGQGGPADAGGPGGPVGPAPQAKPPGQHSHADFRAYPPAGPAGRVVGAAQDQRPPQQFPAAPIDYGDAGPGPAYVPQQGPYSGPQPAMQHAPVPQPAAISLADAVQAAHGEGFNFGQSVARDAPALWLEAVLARKPRMPSDLEARLLQDSALPIDSLLHDEVRHALRRGFWDALERSRR